MSRRRKNTTGAMLDLWSPPQGAGEPVGCLATTYTFGPGLFDEQCLARFLDIDSEPDREDLAFLLERESRLGGVYAGVLVDHTQAGVEHSLRWDVLPVRVRGAKQHAKLGVLMWSQHLRIIVASANLTEAGYRTNREVATTIDASPENAESANVAEAVSFLRRLLLLVPGAAADAVEIARAEAFLRRVERQVQRWKDAGRRGTVRQQLVFTLPSAGAGRPARSSLDEAIQACRGRGLSPAEAWVASPFFDQDEEQSRVTASLCKQMGRGVGRRLRICVPVVSEESAKVPRLAAPRALLTTPEEYNAKVTIGALPSDDEEENPRPWHAKMLALKSGWSSALMAGSSNSTCAGMGVGNHRNVEANLLTIVDARLFSREVGQLEAVWDVIESIGDPEDAEWLGAKPENDEEEEATVVPLPAGFLAATYRAGDNRLIILRVDAAHLPEDWRVHACGQDRQELVSASVWREHGSPKAIELPWTPVQPPEKLLVAWNQHEAFLPINVEDSRHLPPPTQLEQMSADDMLWILASTDPSAAYRVIASKYRTSDRIDPDADLDPAAPPDLDPLKRFDLQATFLHRVRRRARVLAQLRANLQRPAWGRPSLDWRLRGIVGVSALADRFLREFEKADGSSDEALLTLADFLIVLDQVEYETADGALDRDEFRSVFRPFLKDLARRLGPLVQVHYDRVSADLVQFWERVVHRCQS